MHGQAPSISQGVPASIARGRRAVRDMGSKSASGARRLLKQRGYIRQGHAAGLHDWNSRKPPGSSKTWKQHYAAAVMRRQQRPLAVSLQGPPPTPMSPFPPTQPSNHSGADTAAIIAAGALSPIASAIYAALTANVYGQPSTQAVELAARLESKVASKPHAQASVEVQQALMQEGALPAKSEDVHAAVMQAAVTSGALVDSLDVVGETLLVINTPDDQFIGSKNMAPNVDVLASPDDSQIFSAALASTAAPSEGDYEDVDEGDYEDVDEAEGDYEEEEPLYKNPMVLAGAAALAVAGIWAVTRD
jgi:hypothetical protein